MQATYDGAMPTITVPARVGFQFAGYYDQAEGGTKYYNADGSSAINWNKAGDTTLYAQWTANSYQVIFNANGGSGSMDAEEFAYGKEKQLSTNSFAKTGYAFVGWTTEEIAGDVIYVDGASVSNLTTEQGGIVNLYAVWKPITYVVVYNGNGADGSMADQQMTYDKEAALSQIGYTKTGYHFLGWAKTSTAKEAELDNLATVHNLANTAGSKVTLYAVWEANTYTVAFHANGGSGSPMAEQSFTYDEAAKALSRNRYTRTGYTFKGWALTDKATEAQYADQAKVQNLIVMQDGVLDLYAVWTAQSYTVSFDANGGNMMTDSTSKEVTYGSTYGTLPAATRIGYDFAGWYTEKEAGTAIIADSTVSITGDTTLYARWTAKQFTVSFDTNKGSGSSIPTAVNSINVTYDDSYGNLPVTGRTGYTFNGWFTASRGGSEVTANTKVTLTADQTLYAQWTANTYKVTFNTNGGSFADSTTDKRIDQTYDANYTLPGETPTRTGYIFQGWYTSSTAGSQIAATTKMTTTGTQTLYAQWLEDNSVKVGNVVLESSSTAVYAKTDTYGRVTQGGDETNYNVKLVDGVLTLKNATISYGQVSSNATGAIYAGSGLKIVLEGTNKVTSTSTNTADTAWNCGIYVGGDLWIQGSGSLTVTGGKGAISHGISVAGELVIHSVTLTATGQNAQSSSGIYASDKVTIAASAKVTATGGTASTGNSYGIESGADISLNRCSGTASAGRAKSNAWAMSRNMWRSNVNVSGNYDSQTMTWTATY